MEKLLARSLFYNGLLIGFFFIPFNMSGQRVTEKSYYTTGKLKHEGLTVTYSIYSYNPVIKKRFYFGKLKKRKGEWKYWYQNGQIERIENYKLVKNNEPENLPDGVWKYYNYLGVVYRTDIYSNGILKSGDREIYCDTGLVGNISFKNGIPDTSLLIPLTKQDNLIINPDFDFYFYKSVPISYHGNVGIEDWVPFWTTPGKYTPDYISSTRFIDVLDYMLLLENKLPERFNYIGLALFKEDDDYSEYIQGKLTEPLTKGKTYCFKISVNSTRFSKYLVNHLACNFSPAPIIVNDQNEDSFSPQIVFSCLPAEPREFETLCGYFTADGGEKYLTIGRFIKKPDLSVTVKDSFPKSNFNLDRSSYYLIDKVGLMEITDPLECNCRPVLNKLQLNRKEDDTARLKLIDYFDELKNGKKLSLRNVNFDFDSYVLLKSSEDELNTFLQFLVDNPDIRIRIDGHTDNIGTDNYNMELSVKRAESVFNWLVNKGILQSRLEYAGFGRRQPLINSSDEESRRINRRVEVQIIHK